MLMAIRMMPIYKQQICVLQGYITEVIADESQTYRSQGYWQNVSHGKNTSTQILLNCTLASAKGCTYTL